MLFQLCRRSSVVEHTLGKGGVGSSILLGGTIFFNNKFGIRDYSFSFLFFSPPKNKKY